MPIRSAAAQEGVDARRAQFWRRRHITQYVQETKHAQRVKMNLPIRIPLGM